MTGFESIIGIEPWRALFTFCNFMITFLLLRKFLFKPVKKMIDDRQREIDGLYTDAGEAKANAEAMRLDYENRLDSARAERDEIIRDAVKRAQKREQEIIGEANAAANAIREKAEADIAQEKKKALNEVKNEISAISVEIAGKVVGREINAEDHRALMEEFIGNIGENHD